ncbi:hypothetical protein [Empedobacter tilapiae]|uniref:Uncharacterized protein n=1 Tax=Empedobacter tilapiae TaxID=2491114 RepID=A0A4Z1C3N3_9FLAO|nr:hypothetical protein [Empedobacter tilapiae]TGN29692.1 hypothetical protein E4J94_03025 [Empedobacter tilapiae]
MKKIVLLIVLFASFSIKAQSTSKCEKIAANALYNSDYIKELTKDWEELIKDNGGTHYGLQPIEVEKNIYRFVLVQHYPERDYNANWFTIDLTNNKVFEESMVDPDYNKFFNLKVKDLKKLKKCM